MAQKKYVSIEKLGMYDEKIKKYLGDADTATLESAKAYAEGLGSGYDVAGAAATAKSEAVAYTDGQISTVNGTIAGVKTIAEQGVTDAATADGKAVAAQQAVDELAEYVGTIPEGATATDVVGYVIEKTSGIASQSAMTELTNRVGTVEGKVSVIEDDYLKKADKDELAGDIADVQAAVEAEADRADKAEKANAAAIQAIAEDYLKGADKTELQNNINTLTGVVETLRDGVDAEKVDGVKDLIDYVEEHGSVVTGIQGDIAQNASDISGVAGRMTTAEGKISGLETAVSTKVEQSAYDAKVAELAGADTALSGRISTLEGKFGGADGSVEDMVADAKTEAISAAATDAAEKDAALKTELTAAYKKYADDEDAKIETRVDALEADTHTHGNKALLDTYTQTEANLADAVAKKHNHANQSELDLIVAGDKAKWDAAEGNAKSYADTEIGKDRARLDSLEAWHSNFIECSEEDVNNLFA